LDGPERLLLSIAHDMAEPLRVMSADVTPSASPGAGHIAAAAFEDLVYRSFPRFPTVGIRGTEGTMHGCVRQRGDRFYAVIYEGLDPVMGREIRRWHPAGTDRPSPSRPTST
jgi:hypothetical protein